MLSNKLAKQELLNNSKGWSKGNVGYILEIEVTGFEGVILIPFFSLRSLMGISESFLIYSSKTEVTGF